MPEHDREFALILNQTVRVGRRSGFTTTSMGDRRPTGETNVHAALSVYFDINPRGYVWEPPGQMTKVDFIMMALYVANLQPGDLVYPVSGLNGMTIGRLVTVTPILDFDGLTHHIECNVERLP
jgi:hypothetical protein